MKFQYNDGGRAAAGFKGKTGDCVTRAICIAVGKPYSDVYAAMAQINEAYRGRRANGKRTARAGVWTTSAAFKRYMAGIGWEWVPTMHIGQGCKVHLHDGELPMGRLIVAVSKHYTTVIDGVIHDIYDPQRDVHWVEPDHGQPLKPGQWRNENGICYVQRRCVYGYWRLHPPIPAPSGSTQASANPQTRTPATE